MFFFTAPPPQFLLKYTPIIDSPFIYYKTIYWAPADALNPEDRENQITPIILKNIL